MALLPKNSSSGNNAEDNRLSAGRIVEYEQHGKPILAIIVRERKGKFTVRNSSGQELELAPARIYAFPGALDEDLSSEQSCAKLTALDECASAADINLEDLWQLAVEESKELPVSELTELSLGENSLENHLAMRRALVEDRIFFKRSKTGFQPRKPSSVEELKVQAEVEERKRQDREVLLEALANPDQPLPPSVRLLEQCAAFGSKAPEAKKAAEIITEANERLKLSISGRLEDKAFKLLVAVGHFAPDQDLLTIRMHRSKEFPDIVNKEARQLSDSLDEVLKQPRVDLRHLTAFTIDGIGTRDMDDALSLEQIDGGYRLGIHIADAAAVLPRGSHLEGEAFARATSVYCPDFQIPMLPSALSENALSLVAEQDRATVSFFLHLDTEFNITDREICSSLLHVKYNLIYDDIDELLYGEDSDTTPKDIAQTLRTLWDIAGALEAKRIGAGAVQYTRREMIAVVGDESPPKVNIEAVVEDTPARKLVGEMMITANETAALYASDHNLPMIFRGQENPEVDLSQQGLDRPEGPAREYFRRSFLKRSTISTIPIAHFGLGISAYTHVTSPIRRAVDLINQRQLTHAVSTGKELFSERQILELQGSCEAGLDEAFMIQRGRNRYWLLRYLQQQKISELGATVIRTDGMKPFCEIDYLYSLCPFIPLGGRGTKSKAKPGDRIKLKVQSLHPRREIFQLHEAPK